MPSLERCLLDSGSWLLDSNCRMFKRSAAYEGAELGSLEKRRVSDAADFELKFSSKGNDTRYLYLFAKKPNERAYDAKSVTFRNFAKGYNKRKYNSSKK